MSTEPGWLGVRRNAFRVYSEGPAPVRNKASMLLSFERPASAAGERSREQDRART
jgi:hypothetical protein